MNFGKTLKSGLRLYHSLVKRQVEFPVESERQMLRRHLEGDPTRGDMLARLAFLEEACFRPGHDSDLTARLMFERNWYRAASTSLIDAEGKSKPAAIGKLICDASHILTDPLFDCQNTERRVSMIVALHNTLMSVPNAELVTVARHGLKRMQFLLEDAELTEPQACMVFDALHALFFAGAGDVRFLREFDRCVPTFERWLTTYHGEQPPLAVETVDPETEITVVYLLHNAHFDRGNAVSRVLVPMAELHARLPNRRVILYALQHIGSKFGNEIKDSGLIVRTFDQGYRYDRIDEVATAIREDRAHVVVTEQNRALAAALFTRRVAPVQMWFDTGFPYWSLKSLDWTLSPNGPATPDVARRFSRIRCRQTDNALKNSEDPEAVLAIRRCFPDDAFVLGVIVRLVKLDAEYFDFLSELLTSSPNYRLLIAGPGDPTPVEEFLARPDVDSNRVLFVPQAVNLAVYGQVIDAMCDTFPFIGGNACREVAIYGTPVVSKLGTPWDVALLSERLPDLLAETNDAYISIIRRLASDKEFRCRQRELTKQLVKRQTDPEDMINDLEDAIAAAAKLIERTRAGS
jgi:hypothetical protein